MLFSTLSAAFLAGAAFVEAIPAKRADPLPTDLPGIVARYKAYVDTTLTKSKTSCNTKTVVVRKEWRSLSKSDRKKYISAVKCLIKKKATATSKQVPGARNRLDDFVASHMIEQPRIHFNGHMFSWHRHFVWLYEQALRKECGWTGGQPYWDWTLDAGNILASPVFDGSDTSVGSNGAFVPHGTLHFEGFGGLTVDLPPGQGGGCLKGGPFADLIVNLGANQTLAPPDGSLTIREETGPIVNSTSLDYNPHCLTRDLAPAVWANQVGAPYVEYLMKATNVSHLERRIDGLDQSQPNDQPRMHSAGHFVVGGQNNDPFAAPADPAFFLVHSQLDRMYTVWQGQDQERQHQVGGTTTPVDLANQGPKVTPNDKLTFDVIDQARTLKDLTATLEKQYCYRYE